MSNENVMTWQNEEVDFVSEFHDFVYLSVLVCSSAIRNIKKGWITIDFDELCRLDGHDARSWSVRTKKIVCRFIEGFLFFLKKNKLIT